MYTFTHVKIQMIEGERYFTALIEAWKIERLKKVNVLTPSMDHKIPSII